MDEAAVYGIIEDAVWETARAQAMELETEIADRLAQLGLDPPNVILVVDALRHNLIPHVKIHPALLPPWRK